MSVIPVNAATPQPAKTPKPATRISQFRLYKDANKAIPLHLGTKTSFVQRAVAAAAHDPSRIGHALAHRAMRPLTDVTERISISWEGQFAEDVSALAKVMRMSNEEVVRLSVEAEVFCVAVAPTAWVVASKPATVIVSASGSAMGNIAQVLA